MLPRRRKVDAPYAEDREDLLGDAAGAPHRGAGQHVREADRVGQAARGRPPQRDYPAAVGEIGEPAGKAGRRVPVGKPREHDRRAAEAGLEGVAAHDASAAEPRRRRAGSLGHGGIRVDPDGARRAELGDRHGKAAAVAASEVVHRVALAGPRKAEHLAQRPLGGLHPLAGDDAAGQRRYVLL